LQLGLPSAHTQPASNTGHKAYDLITRGYGVGANAPLSVVADLKHETSGSAPTKIASRLGSEPDVVAAHVAVTHDRTAVIQVTPATGPNATATSNLVTRIRSQSGASRA